MKILSIECSATACSGAVLDDDKLLASGFINVKLTHSQTLLLLTEQILKAANININEIDGFAVSNGPGSFTGIRIGISAIKGLAAPEKKPCVGVSTLSSMAQGFADTDAVICAVMDARCNQVYNALFDIDKGEITRLCDDRALLCSELAEEIENISNKLNKKIIVVGDGTDIFYPYIEHLSIAEKAINERKFQNAVGVGFYALNSFKNGNTLSPEELLPVYLRLPQAERELKLKKESSNENYSRM